MVQSLEVPPPSLPPCSQWGGRGGGQLGDNTSVCSIWRISTPQNSTNVEIKKSVITRIDPDNPSSPSQRQEHLRQLSLTHFVCFFFIFLYKTFCQNFFFHICLIKCLVEYHFYFFSSPLFVECGLVDLIVIQVGSSQCAPDHISHTLT